MRKGLLFGCGGCAVIGLAVLVFVGAIITIVFSAMRGSTVSQETFARVQASPVAQSLLGTPMEMGWIITGSVKTTNAEGNADMWIPVSGPKEAASVHVIGKKVNDQWNYIEMTLVTETTHKRIDLLAPSQE